MQNFTQFDSNLILSSDQQSLLITIKKPVEKNNLFDSESSSEDDYLEENMEIEHENLVEFKEFRSKASCKLSEIRGFIYGGFSSRFWMLRKHINQLEHSGLENLPFYAWQCITLQLDHRNIDLVIKDES